MSRNCFNPTHRNSPPARSEDPASTTLAGFPGGSQVRVTGFSDFAMQQRQHLQAHGESPGCTIKILARQAFTILLAEQTE